jgi:hypothetical protein
MNREPRNYSVPLASGKTQVFASSANEMWRRRCVVRTSTLTQGHFRVKWPSFFKGQVGFCGEWVSLRRATRSWQVVDDFRFTVENWIFIITLTGIKWLALRGNYSMKHLKITLCTDVVPNHFDWILIFRFWFCQERPIGDGNIFDDWVFDSNNRSTQLLV